jgi:hypothetical protein
MQLLTVTLALTLIAAENSLVAWQTTRRSGDDNPLKDIICKCDNLINILHLKISLVT